MEEESIKMKKKIDMLFGITELWIAGGWEKYF